MPKSVPASLFEPVTEETEESSKFAEWAGAKRDVMTGKLIPKAPPKRKKTIAAATFERALLETQTMIDTGDFTDCKARHLVALYDLMHRKAYEIEPLMTGTEIYNWTMRSGTFVKQAFGDDMTKALDYLRWVWTREIGNARWRRENYREPRRLGLGLIYGTSMLNDYRQAMNEKQRG